MDELDIINYEILSRKQYDKTKHYYDIHYMSIILFTDYVAKSYDIARSYDNVNKTYSYYIILYKNNKGVPIIRDYSGGYKIPFQFARQIFVGKDFRSNFNVDIKIAEIKDNPNSIIYHINTD